MKIKPASRHRRANAEFSLSYEQFNMKFQTSNRKTYKTIPWMEAHTAVLFGNIDNLFAIKVRRSISQVDRERRAQGML